MNSGAVFPFILRRMESGLAQCAAMTGRFQEEFGVATNKLVLGISKNNSILLRRRACHGYMCGLILPALDCCQEHK